MEGFLNLISAILGVVCPLRKPYPHSLYIGEYLHLYYMVKNHDLGFRIRNSSWAPGKFTK